MLREPFHLRFDQRSHKGIPSGTPNISRELPELHAAVVFLQNEKTIH
jgi:hypothetical protein